MVDWSILDKLMNAYFQSLAWRIRLRSLCDDVAWLPSLPLLMSVFGTVTWTKGLGRLIGVGQQETRDVSAIFKVRQKYDLTTPYRLGTYQWSMGIFIDTWALIDTNLSLFIPLTTLGSGLQPVGYILIYLSLCYYMMYPLTHLVIPIPLSLGRHPLWLSFYCVSLCVYLVNNSLSFPVFLSVVPPTPIPLEVRWIGSAFCFVAS